MTTTEERREQLPHLERGLFYSLPQSPLFPIVSLDVYLMHFCYQLGSSRPLEFENAAAIYGGCH